MSFKKYLIITFTIVVSIILSILFIRSKSPKISILNVKMISKRRIPSLTITNLSKPLSASLIQNGIYPRHTNLTKIMHVEENIPYNDISVPLFITMADIFYLPAVRNFHFQLQNYGLQNNFIVMCLDNECVKLCQSKNILAWQGFVNTSVARIKFDVIIDLSRAGFDFIIFDSDVFLSPSHHPLSSMQDFTDSSWDIQFQLDHYNGRVNIGWFWARPTVQTIDYFIRSKQKWQRQGGWDQAIMNEVLASIEKSRSINSSYRSLSAKRLDPKKFLNFMDTYWYNTLSLEIKNQTNFYNLDDNIRYKLMENAAEEAVIWHYTCVEKSLKMFFSKYFGQWTNLDGYYTNKRKFLTPINIGHGSNNTQVLLIEFLIAVKIALITGRTLIFPDTVVLYPNIKFPAVRTFSINDINSIGIEYVEPTFLYNRKLKHDIDVSSEFNFHLSTKNNESIINLLKRLVKKFNLLLKWKELITLDFSQFKAFNELIEIKNFDQWWSEHIIINDKQNLNISRIQLCRNINQKTVSCLKICT